jgi:hypothetical protein
MADGLAGLRRLLAGGQGDVEDVRGSDPRDGALDLLFVEEVEVDRLDRLDRV